jgi:hypothetical protein
MNDNHIMSERMRTRVVLIISKNTEKKRRMEEHT